MIIFTAVATKDDSAYDFNGLVGYEQVQVISRDKVEVTDEDGDVVWARQIYNSFCYEYKSDSKIIRGVPKGAIVHCRNAGSTFSGGGPFYSEETPRSIQDIINSLQKLERLLSEPFETPFLQLQPEWKQAVDYSMGFIPNGWIPIRFSYKRKQYCLYESCGVKIVHCFTDKDEYILG